MLESSLGRGGGGIPLSSSLLGVDTVASVGTGVAVGSSGTPAADRGDTCDVVVARLGCCGGVGAGLLPFTFTLVGLPSPSSRRSLFLGAMARLCSGSKWRGKGW